MENRDKTSVKVSKCCKLVFTRHQKVPFYTPDNLTKFLGNRSVGHTLASQANAEPQLPDAPIPYARSGNSRSKGWKSCLQE